MKSEALDMKGLTVKDAGGSKIGEVTDFYFDVPTSEPEWLVVTTGLIDKEDVLVPLEGITRDEDDLITPYDKDQIMDAPQFSGTEIGIDTEEALYTHFHLRRELPGRTENLPPWEQREARQGEPQGAVRLRSWKAWSVTA